MFLEYDWAFNVYRPRLGSTFTDIRGHRSFVTLDEAKRVLKSCGLVLAGKSASRTWKIAATLYLPHDDVRSSGRAK